MLYVLCGGFPARTPVRRSDVYFFNFIVFCAFHSETNLKAKIGIIFENEVIRGNFLLAFNLG